MLMLREQEMSDSIQRLDPTRNCPEVLRMEMGMKARVIGQDLAIEQIVRHYQSHIVGLSAPGRPICNLLLLGPTGCGKTRIAESLAEVLVGDKQALIKVDCGEFQHSHEISKLIGSPPGYLGHRETHPRLSQEKLDIYHTDRVKISFVLFDEIEKASDALWNLLLGILDKGTLTLGDNRQVDFSNTMILMTGNLGTAEAERLRDAPFGFAKPTGSQAAIFVDRTDGAGGGERWDSIVDADTQEDAAMRARMEKAVTGAAKRKFSPEFLNRLDRVILCNALTPPQIGSVLDLEMREVLTRVQRHRNCRVKASLSEAARNFLIGEGYDEKAGARNLKRAVEKHFVHPLSSLLATHQLADGDELMVDIDADVPGLVFSRNCRGANRRSLRELASRWDTGTAVSMSLS